MLKAQSAFTLEIDDVVSAVSDIRAQLDLDALGAHTIGLVGALSDYVESGVIAALQDALPFDLVGMTTIAAGSPGSTDPDQLSLLVLSGDDVSFSLALSDPISTATSEPLKKAYLQAASSHEEDPVLVLGYTPLLTTASCDFFVASTPATCDNIPFFGSVCVDGSMDYHDAQVIYQGKGYADRLAYVLVYGNVKPRFYQAGITNQRLIEDTGVVTSSEGNQLRTINGAPVSEFLVSKGINPNSNGEFVSINTFPYVVDYNDGTEPVIRVMFAVTPDGSAVCGGDIPVGATLAVSYFDKNEILASSADTIEEMSENIAAAGDARAVLLFSCIGRFLNLGNDTNAEVQLLHTALATQNVPYALSYSGGEICPVASKNREGSLINRAHNSTFIALVLGDKLTDQ